MRRGLVDRGVALEGGAEEAHPLVAADVAAALPAHPRDPGHRQHGDEERGHQPEQDLHLLTVGTSVAIMTEPTPRSGDRPRVRLCALRETPLDVDEVLAALDDAESGGLTVFVGRVRNHDADKGVTGLDYSAHPTALDKLNEVCERVAAAYDVQALAAVHRVGTLEIGDAAVVVATASAHRGTSFDASRALIDTLKDEVPIWKHQRFADGTDEWVGSP
jgi:molybdopterin synthase catalytic subunit